MVFLYIYCVLFFFFFIFCFFFIFFYTTLKPIGTARDAVVQLCYMYESFFFFFFFCFICDKKVWSFGPYTTKEWQVSLPADGGCSLWQPLPLETDRHSKKKSWPSRVEASSCPELSNPSKNFCLSSVFFLYPFCWFLKQFFKKFSQRRVQYYMIPI